MAAPGFVEVDVPGHGTIEFPEGTPHEDMLAAIHQLPALKGQPTAGDQALGMAKQAGVGAAKTVISNAGLGGDLREAAGSAADWVASKFSPAPPKNLTQMEVERAGGPPPDSFNSRFTGTPDRTAGDIVKQGLRSAPGLAGTFFNMPTAEQVKSGVEGYTGEFRKPQNVGEEYAGTVGEFLPAMVAGPGGVARETVGKTLATALLKEAPKRLVTNAVLPGVTSEAAGQAVRQVSPAAEPYARFAASMTPAAAMSAGQAAWRGVRQPNIPAKRQAAIDRMNDEGVTAMSPGEMLGDTNRRYNEGNALWRAQALEEQKLRQLTAAAVRKFGEEGEDFREALKSGHARIGPAMGESAGKLKVRMDPELGDALVGIDKATLKEGLNPDQVNRLRAVRDHIVETFGTVARKSKAKNAAELQDWTEVKGPAFQNLIANDSMLQGAIDESGRVGHYAKQMKKALLDAADRTANRRGTKEGTGDRQALADYLKYRRQYANMMAMEEGASVGGENPANGLLTPASLRQIATNRDKSDYFLGRGDYANLASDANMLMTPLPNSGTAQRLRSMLPWSLLGTVAGSIIGGAAAPGVGHAVGATVGAAAGPALKAHTVRLKPWWLDQDKATRQHLAALLQSEVAGRKLLEGPDQSR